MFGKGGKTRHILLTAGTWEALCAIRDDAGADDPVFVSRKGSRLSMSQALRIVRNAAKRAGVDLTVSPHWLRHCHGSHALDRGAARISFRPRWDTPQWPPRDDISMHDQRRAVRNISLCEAMAGKLRPLSGGHFYRPDKSSYHAFVKALF